MFAEFHFQEPFWFLFIIPLMILFWLASHNTTNSKSWSKIIDSRLLPLLLQGEDKNTYRLPKIIVSIAWLLTIFALADPVWEKIPRPVYQTNAARVLVLDLSNSMLIDDLKPNRLARARFKIEDILSKEEEGQTGLVLFAGEAFTASPLTRDTETIRSLLEVLTPQIMPLQGSRADLGLVKAHELLKQAGITNGQILLIADGVSKKSDSMAVAEQLRIEGHTVSVMAVGTEEGGKLNFRDNTSVSVKLESDALRNIATSGGGNYHLISTSNSDIDSLLVPITDNTIDKEQTDNEVSENQEWKSTGPYLVLLLIPIAALAFRKGWLLNIFVVCTFVGLMFQPHVVMAEEEQAKTNFNSLFETLTKNKAQRANNALINKDYEKARDLSEDSFSKGSAEYKLKNYESALENFKLSQGADARYNEGNALAKLKRYDEAIAAYDQALKLNPKMTDAIDNKKLIEEFLKNVEQQSENNQESNEEQSSDENKQDNADENQQEQQDNKNNEEQEGNNSEEQNKQDASSDETNEENEDKENQFSNANEDLNDEENTDPKSSEEATEEEQKESNEVNSAEENPETDEQELSEEKQINAVQADELNEEERMAAEQWLRRIPDDPGVLLRRKFRYQYDQNRRNDVKSTEQPW